MSAAGLPVSIPSGWRVSKLLVSSYVLDWVLILLTGAAGRILKFAEPNRNPFSLTDPSISYPHTEHETVSATVLVLVGLIAPAIIILLASLLYIPGFTATKRGPTALVWRRKLWEWNVGWMGLGIAYAGVYASTEALKAIYGKPRPDLLSRCNPNLSDIAAYVVGGLGEKLRGAPVLVSYKICQNTSEELTRDGFVSFPSGHASSSFAGLTYLTLWLCAKFSISVPYLAPRHFTKDTQQIALTTNNNTTTGTTTSVKAPPPFDAPYPSSSHPQESPSEPSLTPLRNQSAAPPTYLLLIAAAPIVAATYIGSSRWFDNRHHGFDIIFGSALGIFFAWLGFHWYHLPLSSGGAGWAWGARSPERAFFAGIGTSGYIRDSVGKATGSEGSSTRPDSASGLVQRGENNV
ncbi:hypothetical protein AJ79_00316 [Helicocarpus griseus UAMH5409]|uniref:Phosphatidic acid phosphatase type 2/haloperoxidase domain-containing protein n=1 Tax=Helicocarpus griseus UAMH5409 TaxID=1447875 RepID=A0A2B7YD56_9EURO|nr:hypothetical protein AJ79_00316 [Helicocarpus griseus UAMH5409]